MIKDIVRSDNLFKYIFGEIGRVGIILAATFPLADRKVYRRIGIRDWFLFNRKQKVFDFVNEIKSFTD